MKQALVILYILFICIFSYLPKSVATVGFILFIFYAIYYLWYKQEIIRSAFTLSVETRRLSMLFICFLLIASFYFLLSFYNLPRLWNIQRLGFNVSFLPRHFFIIAELFLPIALSYEFFIMKPFHRLKISFLIPFGLLLFLLNSELCIKGLLLLAITIVAWKCHSKLIMLLAFFLNYEQSAYILGFLAMMVLLFFEQAIISFLNKNTTLKIVTIMFVAIIGIFLSYGLMMVYIKSDPNSLWRLSVWINEIESLSKTWFTGVGFGSAYVTNDIIFQVNNSNMYTTNVEGGLESGIYLVANHSSLLNMFYRMGLLGGLSFLALNVQLIRVVVITYQQAIPEMKSLLWRLFAVFIYETIIIALNPGLEMMQFALSYILSLSVLLAVVIEIQHQGLILREWAASNRYESE